MHRKIARYQSVLLVFCCFALAIACSASVVTLPTTSPATPVASNVQDFEFEQVMSVFGNGAMVTRYTGQDTEVIIPSRLGGAPVIVIGSTAFTGLTDVVSVVLPETVAHIESGAFAGCTSLASINLPGRLSRISDNTFRECVSLTEIILPDNLREIGDSAFSGSGLQNIIVPELVERIGSFAFRDCTSLTNITLPRNLRHLPSNAFSRCSSLIHIDVDEENSTFKSIEGVLYGISYRRDRELALHLWAYPEQLIVQNGGVVAFPDGLVDSIYYLSSGLFEGSAALREIHIPDNVSSISSRAFAHCVNLTKITLPTALTEISVMAFLGNVSLGEIILPNQVTRIWTRAFQDCTNLSRIYIPESVIEIDEGVFEGISNLTIYGIASSYAEIYARSEGIDFIAID